MDGSLAQSSAFAATLMMTAKLVPKGRKKPAQTMQNYCKVLHNPKVSSHFIYEPYGPWDHFPAAPISRPIPEDVLDVVDTI